MPTIFSKTASQTLAFTQTSAGRNTVSVHSASQTLSFVQSQTRGLVLPTGITITERIESRNMEHTSKGRELIRIFTINGTDDPVQADALGPQIGDTYDDTVGNPEGSGFTDLNLFVGSRVLEPLIAGSGGPKAVMLEVKYFEANRNPKGSGVNRQVSLDISGQVVRVERAFSQKHFPTLDANQIEKHWGLAIGPETKEFELKGVGRFEAAVSLSEIHMRSRLSEAYIQTLLDMHGTVNRDLFRGFAVGIVLFLSARATTNPDGGWEVQYEFVIAPKSRTFTITEFVKGTKETLDVSGHEYLWFEWTKEIDETIGIESVNLLRKVKTAHIATIYKSADFSVLDIGTEPLT